MLRVPVDKVCVVIALAREALGNEPPDEAAPSDGVDGQPFPSSEDYDDTRFDALFDYVDALNGDELADLLALCRLGDGESDDWDEACTQAEDEVAAGDAVAQLIQHPTLPDDLAAGLEALGYDSPEA